MIFAVELLGPNTDILQAGLFQMDYALGHGLDIRLLEYQLCYCCCSVLLRSVKIAGGGGRDV